jgi:hypothetical protein
VRGLVGSKFKEKVKKIRILSVRTTGDSEDSENFNYMFLRSHICSVASDVTIRILLHISACYRH